MKKRKHIKIGSIPSTLFLVLLSLLCAFPFYWAMTSSFKKEVAMNAIPPEWVPSAPTLDNFADLFRRTNMARWMGNSFFVSLCTVALICIIACLAGYAFTRMEFPGKKVVWAVIIATMLLPKYVMLVPLYNLMKELHWFNTYWGLIIPEVGNALPFAIFLVRQFMSGIPKEIFESATVDGCSKLQSFLHMAVPMSKPAIASLAILMFVRSWNDYMWQLIVVSKDEMRTVLLGVASLQTENVKLYGQIISGAMVSALPLILIFIVFQRYFVKGLSNGAVKG